MFETIKNILILKDKEQFFFYFLCFFTFALPLYKISSSPFLIIFSLLIIINLTRSKFQILRELRNYKINFFFLSLFCLITITLSYSSNINNGIKEVKNLLPLLIFPLLFTYVKLKRPQIILLLKSFIMGCLLAFFLSVGSQFLNFLNGHEYSFYYSKLVEILWMHPTYLSMYLNFAILIAYFLLIKKEISLTPFVLSVIVFILFILLLSARMQIINLLVMGLFISIHLLKNYFNYKRFIGLIGFSIIFVFIAINNQFTLNRFKYISKIDYNIESENFKEWNGANVRLAIWDCATDVIKENLVFGVGVGDEDDELLKAFKNRKFNFAYNLNYVAHNQYVQFLISNGIIGLISYLSIIIYCFYYAFKNKHFLLIGLSILLLFSGFTESFLKMQSGIVFFSFMIMLLFQYKTFQKD